MHSYGCLRNESGAPLFTRSQKRPHITSSCVCINSVQEVANAAKLVCVHDSARPLVLAKDIRKVIDYVLGVPMKATIKEVNSILLIIIFVTKTLDRKFFMGDANSTGSAPVTPYYSCYTIDPFGLS